MADIAEPPSPSTAMSAFTSGFADLMKDTPAQPTPDADSPPAEPSPTPEPSPAAAKVDPQPAPAAEPAKPVVDPEEKWPRTAAEWKKFKEARKERETALTTELNETKSKIKDYEEKLSKTNNAVDPAIVESLKKERDELSERLRLTAVERHPDFQKHFDQKISAQYELAKRIVGPDKADTMVRLLKSEDGPWKDQEIEALVSDLNGIKQGQVAGVLNALSEINAHKSAVLADAKGHYEKLVTEQKAKADSQKQLFANALNAALSKASDPKTGNPLYQKRDGDTAWNSAVEKRIESAKGMFSGNMTPDQLIQAALDATAFPAILEQGKAVFAENEKLRAQIAELTKATPGIQGKGPEGADDGTPQPVQVKVGMNPMEAGGEFFKKLRTEWGQGR